jgi:hypothetical protein
MKKYVMANIKIPIVINENGMFDMLNEYTQTEITVLNELPSIEEEDDLYKKIMEFLQRKESENNLEEEPVEKIKIKDNIEEERSEESSEESSEERSEEMKEQILTICTNNIKMRKHSDNMTFKNLKKGAKLYTRKTYFM